MYMHGRQKTAVACNGSVTYKIEYGNPRQPTPDNLQSRGISLQLVYVCPINGSSSLIHYANEFYKSPKLDQMWKEPTEKKRSVC